ncbi:MAG: hypothetical protein AAGE86_12305 [Pseudomonadota bacterium]
MPSLIALAVPLALLLPLLGQAVAPDLAETLTAEHSPKAAGSGKSTQQSYSPAARVPNSLDAMYDAKVAQQVRIERRVVVRVSPQRGQSRQNLLAALPQQGLNARYEERKMDKCVPVNGIAGVQTGSGNRLLLFLRDQRIITINLEKACRARDFYSGFYVERNDDGNLCVDRDELQSRSGARCEVERMRQLVAVRD